MRNERRMSGSERGDEKPAAEMRHGAHLLLYAWTKAGTSLSAMSGHWEIDTDRVRR